MRGTILGYSDNKGVIVTEDGRRFTFTGENWREPEPPVRGTQVDFVEIGESADEIYLALGAAQPAPAPAAPPPAAVAVAAAPPVAHDPAAPPPVPAAPGSDPGQAADQALRRIGASIRAFPQTLIAGLILFTFLIISYASIGGGGGGEIGLSMREYPTLMSLNESLAPVRERVAQLGDRLDRQGEALANAGDTSTGMSDYRVRQAQEMQRVGSAYSWLNWTLIGAYFFWFIPLLCIAVWVLKLAGRRKLAIASSIALGVLSLIAAFYIMLLESAVYGLAASSFGPGFEGRAELRRSIGRAFDLGFGGYLIGILGVACIAVLFLPRRGEAAPAEEAAPAVEPRSPPDSGP